MVGKKLGHYEIVEKLGEGGMGVVYRAHDSSLNRDVAIKVLPESFVSDPERKARFAREARLLATLSHPNIAAIHGLEEADGKQYLILELVEGQTLADRIKKGRIPLDETLDICCQITEGLEAAHEKGIIHRDLKPANIKITPEGNVKILDFGLARAFHEEPEAAELSHSPTITDRMTRPGVILGTATYMSPEQAKGKVVDKRTDIWAFGCILYECLTGKRPFEGETVTETLAAILRGEPNWQALAAAASWKVKDLLHRCLQKDPRDRLRDIGDARIEMNAALILPPDGTLIAAENTRWGVAQVLRISPYMTSAAFVVTGVLIGMLISAIIYLPQPKLEGAIRSVLPLSQAGVPRDIIPNFPLLALSPDGQRLVYVGSKEGTPQLFLRQLDQMEAFPLAGTAGATNPFFSHDGTWIGFFAEGRIKRLSVADGSTAIICSNSGLVAGGAFWGADDKIIFSPQWNTGLRRVSPGAQDLPHTFTKTNPEQGDFGHGWPQLLPGEHAILFISKSGKIADMDDAQIVVQEIATGYRHSLGLSAAYARYVSSTGHIVYVRNSTLYAVPFDLSHFKIAGQPVAVVEGIMTHASTGAAQFAFSSTGPGILAYIPGGKSQMRSLVWVDRRGARKEASSRQADYNEPRISADGRLAVRIAGANDDVHVCEMARNNWIRLSDEEGDECSPVWTPDGKTVAYSSESGGPANIFLRAADGSGLAQLLLRNENWKYPSSFSPDQKYLAFVEVDASARGDIWILPMEGERKPQPLIRTPYHEYAPRFSPDGHWLAYTSDSTGRDEVYILDFPGKKNPQKVSIDGGSMPVWANKSGRELFYCSGKKMMAVSMDLERGRPGVPFTLFESSDLFYSDRQVSGYDVADDGQQFLLPLNPVKADAPRQINLVINWFEELKRLCPAGR